MYNNTNTLAAMFWYLVNGRELRRDAINDLLFISDAYQFVKTGKTLSNIDYVKKPISPVPVVSEEVLYKLKIFDFISERKSENSGFIDYTYTAKLGDIKKVVLDINNGDTETLEKVIASLPRICVNLIELKGFEPWKSTAWDQVLDFNKIDENFKAWMRDNIK